MLGANSNMFATKDLKVVRGMQLHVDLEYETFQLAFHLLEA